MNWNRTSKALPPNSNPVEAIYSSGVQTKRRWCGRNYWVTLADVHVPPPLLWKFPDPDTLAVRLLKALKKAVWAYDNYRSMNCEYFWSIIAKAEAEMEKEAPNAKV